MRVLTLIVAAAAGVGLAAVVSADAATDRILLAQAQDAGAQSGAAKATQPGGAGNREGGAAAARSSEGKGASVRDSGGDRTTVRSQGTSRTSVQRSGGARVSVRGGSRTAVGVRTAASDDAVIIKRKKARRYVYSEPSATVIKKKRYATYREPSSTVIVKKRRPGVAVESGVSTRTSVRSQTSTSVRERPFRQGNVGAGSSTEGRTGQSTPKGARSGGEAAGQSAPTTSGGQSRQ
jgi:hypothetical protein